jgi:hypothetical protein
MFKNPLFYIFLLYGLSFIVMFTILIRAINKATVRTYVDAFYMLAAFANIKSLAIVVDGIRLFAGSKIYLYSLILVNVSSMLNVISNVFLLHFGIELITYKAPHRKIYRIFPLLLFIGYLVLYVSGIFDALEVTSMARFGFCYNAAILSSVACLTLYYSLKQSKNVKVPKGILATALGLILYSIFEGLTEKPISGVSIYIFRMFSAIILMAASWYLVALFDEKKICKIDYV